MLLSLQELCVDIADRDPSDHSGGIPYKLLAESCIPSINVEDIGSIFEEHRVCKNLNVWQHTNAVSKLRWAFIYTKSSVNNLYIKAIMIW